MNMEERMPSEPSFDRRCLVRAVVVHHQMHVQLGRHISLDGAKELQEFAAAMAPIQLADHLAGGDVQRRKQRRRAVAHVVVSSRGCLGPAAEWAACGPAPGSGSSRPRTTPWP